MSQDSQPGMLSGLKVLSFCHFIQGTTASQYLADMGADVVKVESPQGAWERAVGSARVQVQGRSVTHLAVNRNKRSLAIDLKHPRALEVLTPLIRNCDVVMENYRLGVLDRLGLGYDDLRRIKPDIIYASATGWGATGPMRSQPGVDVLVQARTGLVNAAMREGRPTSAPGLTIVDQHGGTLLALGVLAAYVRRLRTGQGGRVESSLLAAGLDLQTESLALYFSGRKTAAALDCPPQLGTWYVDPPYGLFQLADAHVAMVGTGAIEDFNARIGSAALIAYGPRGHVERRDDYVADLARELRGWTHERLATALAGSAFWIERVASYDDLAHDEQVRDQQRFGTVRAGSERATVLNPPVAFDGQFGSTRIDPPELGQHTRELLGEAGFDPDAIDALLHERVVAQGA